MKTSPIRPTVGTSSHTIAHDPHAAWRRAERVFVNGSSLPQRWAGRADFVVLATPFGCGHAFLATWAAWRRDPQRCTRLHFVAIDAQPLQRADLARLLGVGSLTCAQPELAAQLLQAWPPLTPNLHSLDFEHGQVRLTLALGEFSTVAPALRLQADCFFLDVALAQPQSAPELRDSKRFKTLARLAQCGALCVDAGADCGPARRRALQAAGFEVQPQPIGAVTDAAVLARYAPRFVPRRLPSSATAPIATGATATPSKRSAVVVGAGLAGAAVAQALARLGVEVLVLDGAAQLAQGASGNTAGLFHGAVHPEDGRYARLFRAAALAAASAYRAAVAEHGAEMGQVNGLLRLTTTESPFDPSPAPSQAMTLAKMQALLQHQALPGDWVQALDAQAASAQAGVQLQQPAWFYPSGGWLAPPLWVQHAMACPGVQWRGGAAVARLQRHGDDWLVLNAQGTVLARTALLVLANAEGAMPLLADLGMPAWPLRQTRGQVTQWATTEASALKIPLAGDGYALPLPGALLCGATRQNEDSDPALRQADHRHNLQRFERLTGLAPPADPQRWRGRVGWRLHTDDQLPIAGPVAALQADPSARADQCRLLRREPGLFVLTALGARGVTLAPLLGRLVAAQATGTPWPLEQDLADAVDPARWRVHKARKAHKVREATSSDGAQGDGTQGDETQGQGTQGDGTRGDAAGAAAA